MTFRTPAGRPASLHDLGEQQAGQRGQVGGLEDHGATGRDGGSYLAGGHGQREVPRRDQEARTNRLLLHKEAVLAVRCSGVAAGHADGFLGEPAQELGTVGNLATCLGQRLAHFKGHEEGEVFGTLGDEFEGAAQDFAAFARCGAGPVSLGGSSGVECGSAVFSTGVGDAEQDLARGRVLNIESFSRSGRTPLTVDQQAGGNGSQQFAFAFNRDSHGDSFVWGCFGELHHWGSLPEVA
ncbi:hypothetical protein ABIA52_002877 [Paenarthrobacter histidinolovorans]|uniref:Uncharacterized protein n=1 Tax=Paenarthrobacter histidinolovorans TaxID=43664 RepID=A0ABW8N8S9_9MICC